MRIERRLLLFLGALSVACSPLRFSDDAGSKSSDARAGDEDAAIARVRLMVEKAGQGAGVVSSEPEGIDCNTTCSADFDRGSRVTLAAAAAADSRFLGWSGSCAVIGGDCVVMLDAPQTITATFGPDRYALTATITGDGDGRIVSDSGAIDCGSTCSARISADTTVMLTAMPLGASRFVEWRGSCSGSSSTCLVTMDRMRSVEAAFAPPGGFARFRAILDLGAVPGGSTSWAWSANAMGWTTGWSRDGSARSRAFRSAPDASSMIDLGTLGGDASVGLHVNPTGWIVGDAQNAAGLTHAFLCAPSPSTMLTDLGTFGGAESIAYGINATNWIAGSADTSTIGVRHAFRRTPAGEMIDLGTLGGTYSTARDINDEGWVVGDATLANEAHHAFRAAPEPERTLEDLRTLGGLESYGYAISDTGITVGFSQTQASATHAFFVGPRPATSMEDLGTLGGTNSFGYAVNAGGCVVGAAETAQAITHAFIWDPAFRVMVDLDDLLPRGASAWELQYATAISDAGDVTGVGLHGGIQRAFRLAR